MQVIGTATARMSRDLMARAVLVVTQSGISAHIVSTARPAAPIVAVTGNQQVFHRMSLLCGVVPIYDPDAGKANPNELARKITLESGLGV
ncbi:MAG: pyruvate kinase alpha/beta domain-containing protein [Pseudomonadales bacterium]|nr:pyruvate kinase alpha/beta domain-containing protein [Pseudomonadales bacterium]